MPGADGKSSLKSKGKDFNLPRLEDSVTPDTGNIVGIDTSDLISTNISKLNRNYVDNFQKTSLEQIWRSGLVPEPKKPKFGGFEGGEALEANVDVQREQFPLNQFEDILPDKHFDTQQAKEGRPEPIDYGLEPSPGVPTTPPPKPKPMKEDKKKKSLFTEKPQQNIISPEEKSKSFLGNTIPPIVGGEKGFDSVPKDVSKVVGKF